MKRAAVSMSLVTVLATGALLVVLPGRAEAEWFHRRWSPRPPRYDTVIVLPRSATPIVVGESTYYYCRGVYYKPCPRGYVRVPAPVGAVVATLPEEHKTIIIDGTTYHYYDGVYYKGGPAGYTVVPVYQSQPAPAGQQTTAAQPVTTPAAGQNTIVVNVPNKNGSYTPVTLQLASGGMYIGPQGEVYPNQPAIGQLQAMYGK